MVAYLKLAMSTSTQEYIQQTKHYTKHDKLKGRTRFGFLMF
jgi:hypothetical protein